MQKSMRLKLVKNCVGVAQRELFIDNLLVRIHFIIVMIRWTGLAPCEFECPFPGILASNFQVQSSKSVRSWC